MKRRSSCCRVEWQQGWKGGPEARLWAREVIEGEIAASTLSIQYGNGASTRQASLSVTLRRSRVSRCSRAHMCATSWFACEDSVMTASLAFGSYEDVPCRYLSFTRHIHGHIRAPDRAPRTFRVSSPFYHRSSCVIGALGECRRTISHVLCGVCVCVY